MFAGICQSFWSAQNIGKSRRDFDLFYKLVSHQGRNKMNKDLMSQKIQILLEYGLAKLQAIMLVSGGSFLQDEGGSDLNTYWNNSKNFTVRDEFFLIANTILPLAKITTELEGEDWLLTFQAAFLSQVKQTVQSVRALDLLALSNCYADAFSVIRALHSRTNLMILFSLNPYLFRHWLDHPKDPKYLDGHIRNELGNHGLRTMIHSYEHNSELLHGQIQAHAEVGLFEKGIFNDIFAIKNQLYVLGKFIVAAFAHTIIQASMVGEIKKGQNKEEIANFESMFNQFFDTILSQNRWDHLFATIAKDRHWEKIGKKKYDIGGAFNYLEYKDQLIKFHRSSGQRKQLSKAYR